MTLLEKLRAACATADTKRVTDARISRVLALLESVVSSAEIASAHLDAADARGRQCALSRDLDALESGLDGILAERK